MIENRMNKSYFCRNKKHYIYHPSYLILPVVLVSQARAPGEPGVRQAVVNFRGLLREWAKTTLLEKPPAWDIVSEVVISNVKVLVIPQFTPTE